MAWTDGIGGAAVGAVAGGLASIGSGKRARKLVLQQEQSQSRLNEQAAKLGYDYGELAADSAHERSLALQQNQADLTSYKAQVADLKEAGANPALALAGGGANVGAGGGAMGGSGGSGGRAGGAAEAAEQELQRKGLALELGKVVQEGYLIKAERDKAKAEEKQIEAETKGIEQQNESFESTNALQDELLRQQGISQWIDNVRKDWENSKSRHSNGYSMEGYRNQTYDINTWVKDNSYFQERIAAEIGEIVANTELTTEKQKHYWQEILNATIQADASKTNAYANKLAAEYETGTGSNAREWTDTAARAVGILIRAIATKGK